MRFPISLEHLFWLGALLLLGGCQSAAPVVTPVDPAILDALVTYFNTLKGPWSVRNAFDVHKFFFIRRRAKHLGETHAAWVAEANQTTLKARLDSEYTTVLAFLTAQLGTRAAPGPILSGAGNPPHLDLADLARLKTTTGNSAATSRAARYRERRREWVRAIIWRAAAIHDDLWQPSADERSATIRNAAMNEVLDRRLHAVERMSFQVSRADTGGLGENPSWTVTGANGPWTDGFRVRMFEYPRVRNIPRFRNAIGAANIAGHGVAEFVPPHPWHESRDAQHRRLEWNVGPDPGIRHPTAQAPSWTRNAADSYQIIMRITGATAAAKVDALFTPNTDWWERTWIFCDHAICAINLEAFRFGKRRRLGNDTLFNAVLSGNAQGFVVLDALVGRSRGIDANVLQADDVDPHFENRTTDLQDLQVGDQLIFWNSFVYGRVTVGDWRLENALIMGIGNDARGLVTINSIRLQGHGTAEKAYGPYRNEIVGHFAEGLQDARGAVTAAIAANPAATSVNFLGRANSLVRWSPFESFDSPGAWWVRLPIGTSWPSLDAAVAAVALSVKDDAAFANHPAVGAADSVFFPLWQPAMQGGWNAYLTARRANPAFRPASRLRAVIPDGNLTPGLYHNAPGSPIPIIRPKVTP